MTLSYRDSFIKLIWDQNEVAVITVRCLSDRSCFWAELSTGPCHPFHFYMAGNRTSHLRSSRRDRYDRGCHRREVASQGSCPPSTLFVSSHGLRREWSLPRGWRGRPRMPPEELREIAPGTEARYRFRCRFHGRVSKMGHGEWGDSTSFDIF